MRNLLKREPDFNQFLKVLRRHGKPSHLPFYEHKASPGFIAQMTGTHFDNMSRNDEGYWQIYVDFWLAMGFDCVPMEIRLNCPLREEQASLTAGSEAQAVFRTMSDFESYEWPDESTPIDFAHFEVVERLIPPGVKIVGGVGRGPYEWGSLLMGTVGLSYALVDNAGLVEAVFEKLGRLHCSAVRQLASMEGIGAVRQGDDLGFKTSTFLSPEYLRRYIFPIYSRMVSETHAAGKPFILHSCGNLAEIYNDLIEHCRIDAKHSFEDAILPVAEFKRLYGDRVTALGGLDVDVICRSPRDEIRAYTRKHIEDCFGDGYWALGTGNSLTDYMPVDNYIAVLDEAMKVTA